ncbi:BTAD domain-containing putative transcriptional regulator [Georgenia sp. MJ170]|uniref:BTAD domain-containing putative transcriptional regulator n=1 Tax=Georgenia sunbinii TaxID=3117728 RepID=UPI002F264DC9
MHAGDVRPAAPRAAHPLVPQASVAVPPVGGLRRPQLLNALDPVTTTALGLVVAPAGTGKTTLLAQWAVSSTLPVAWCRLDVGATRPGRLVEWLWQALEEYVIPPPRVPPRTVEELALALEQHPGRILLVLDDLHRLASSTGEAELEQLLLLAPPQLRVVIGSRQMPSFNLARSELPPIVVLTGDDLRFRTWEVEKLFRSIHRAPLPPQDVAALTRYTQGWAAALQLFHLATMEGDVAARQRAVHALAGRSRYAQGYLTGQVLAGLPAETTEFLVRTCVFDALTASRCDALLGARTSQRTLHELVDRQALTTTTDGGETFTYHDVLRRHLEATLHEELGATATREWYERAAQILEDEGDVIEALRARCRAEDWNGVRRLLQEFGPRLFDGPHRTRSGDHTWSDLVPRWLIESDPWCCLAEARRMLNDGRLDDAAAMSRQAEAQFTDPAARKLCEDIRAEVTAWQSGAAGGRPGWPDMLLAATRRDPLRVAREARDSDSARVRRTEGFALVLGGDRRGGQRLLRDLAAEPGVDPGLMLAARLLLATIEAVGTQPLEQAGRRHTGRPLSGAAGTPLDQIYRDAERHGLSWLARLTSSVAVVVQSPRAVNEIAGVVADLDRRGDRWSAALVSICHTFVMLRSGTVDLAALERLRTRLRALGAGVLEVWIAAVGALLTATEQLPDATDVARAAEAQARVAGVPGAAAFAYAALAAAEPAQRDDFLALARATASSSGLDCRPWAWLPDMSPWRRGAATGGGADAGGEPSTVGRSGAGNRSDAADERTGTAPRRTASSDDAASPDDAAPAGSGDSPDDAAHDDAGGDGAPRAGSPVPGATIELTCFGEFRLLVRGRRADLGAVRPRVRAMLKFLAIHAGRPVHRELIADALWGDLDPEAAMHNLQVSLSSLRAALEPGVPGRRSSLIIRDGETYMLALRPGSRCDIVEFDRELAAANHARRSGDVAAQLASLATALALYTADLFPEEGPANWLVTTRERYRARAADAAAQLADLNLAAGDHTAAIAAAQHSIEIDEYRDDAGQALIQALRAAGEPAAAHRAVRAYTAVLHELGVEPLPDIVSVPGTPPPRPRPAPAGSHRMPRGSSDVPPRPH